MRFLVLINCVFFCVFGVRAAESLVGATNVVDAAELQIARAALRDGLWDVARAHAAKAGGTDALLIILESHAAEDHWDDVRAALPPLAESEPPALAYYRAAVKGDFSSAAEALRTSGSLAGAAAAKMLEAQLFVRAGKRTSAERLWREVITQTNASAYAFAVAAANLGDVSALRTAFAGSGAPAFKRMIGLRLGQELVKSPETAAEGDRLVRAIVKDSPDAAGACAAFVSLAVAAAKAERWQEAAETYRDAVEIWPEAAKLSEVQLGRGEVLLRLGQHDEAMKAFVRAGELASDDSIRALALMRLGDSLSETGRSEEAMVKYHEVLDKYPSTTCARDLKKVVEIREREAKGREYYRAFRFADAQKAFADVGAADATRRARMDYFTVLCLYGQGKDTEARARAKTLAETCADAAVRADASLWLAKFAYNRREWKDSVARFVAFADAEPKAAFAPEALLWATRAAFADNDFNSAIRIATKLAEAYPKSPVVSAALLVQSEALLELARFDAAVLVLEQVARAERAPKAERTRAEILKADALFAMGADNSARYEAALEAYRAISFSRELSPSLRLVIAAKVARTLEKLKRREEAFDQYYTRVVLAYRDGRARGERYDDEARAAFSRAGFRLAEEYESRGKDFQALKVLELISASDVPAVEEAERRIDRLTSKGRFL